jgi:hypothetical protein
MVQMHSITSFICVDDACDQGWQQTLYEQHIFISACCQMQQGLVAYAHRLTSAQTREASKLQKAPCTSTTAAQQQSWLLYCTGTDDTHVLITVAWHVYGNVHSHGHDSGQLTLRILLEIICLLYI